MAAEVSMDYGAVESMAQGFSTSADTFHAVDRALESAVAVLRASAFIGMVGNLALAEYLDNIRPNVARLAATCEEMNNDLLGAIASLRDGDYSGSQRFAGGMGGNPAAGGGAPTAPGQPAPVTGKPINYLDMYKDGQNGWKLIVAPNGSFTPDELVDQGSRPACTVYGAMNLLIENGYDISQADADKLYQDELKNIDLWSDTGVFMDIMDGKHDIEGFDIHHAENILDKYGAGYDHDDFSTYWGLGSPDRGAAENFLVKQVNSGKPVYVTTEVNESFGMGSGGHAYTVIGTQTDSNGKLTNVMVSSNWGQSGGSVWEIPAKQFMDDWMEWNDGEYIVLNK